MATATPVVSFPVTSSAAFLGSTQTVDLTFANNGPSGDTGYTPYIDLTLPTGADGIQTFQGATFLGSPLTTSVISTTSTTETVRIMLPFGSFQTDQTPANVLVTLGMPTNTNALGTQLQLSAIGGFANGNSATGSTPIVQPTANTYDFTPELMTVTSSYLGPQGQAASGPAFAVEFNEAFQAVATIANGVTITGLNLNDPLPNGAIATEVTVTNGPGNTWY